MTNKPSKKIKKMKKYIKPLLILLAITTAFSCSKDAATPEVSFSADKLVVATGETVTFTYSGDAETFVIYTGDPSKEWAKSYAAITAGQNTDQGLWVLTQEKLPELEAWITQQVERKELDTDVASVMAKMQWFVDKEFPNVETPAYFAFLQMREVGGQNTEEMVRLYFENRGVYPEPEEDWSTGVALNRYSNNYEYTYSAAGTYTVTLVATTVGGKDYSGQNLEDDRTASGDQYDPGRTIIIELIITVE